MVEGNELVPKAADGAGFPNSDSSITDPDKIVVYCAFPSSNDIVIQALNLHNISCLPFSGKMSPLERQDIINTFKRGGPGDPRVLLLSPCGLVGLNLPCANFLVIVVSSTISHCFPFQILILLNPRIHFGPLKMMTSLSVAYGGSHKKKPFTSTGLLPWTPQMYS